MTSYLSRLSPVPGFPDYTGPHKVGTIDVELPVSELDCPSPSPDENISTVQYRIFYPCQPDAKGKKNVNWLPAPQRGYISAYTKFLGAGSMLADLISYFPNHLSYISIPVRKNAPLLQPKTSNKRWPVMIFSHGLGGSRNAYSHLAGSIASHGIIVFAPEHRDGSTPISYIRDVPSNNSITEKSAARKSKRTVDYIRLSHTPSPEVEAGRNAQLKVRLWELGAIHDSLLKLDLGEKLENLNTSSTSLLPFKDMMDVHTPGKITFAGHSFGAATVAQFVKSTFYSSQTSNAPSSYEPLFLPSSRSPITSQITPQTPSSSSISGVSPSARRPPAGSGTNPSRATPPPAPAAPPSSPSNPKPSTNGAHTSPPPNACYHPTLPPPSTLTRNLVPLRARSGASRISSMQMLARI